MLELPIYPRESLLFLILALRLSIPFLDKRRAIGILTIVHRQFGKENCGF
jgi:hypothetical protein